MPNWCENKWEIHCNSPEEAKSVAENLKFSDDVFSFEAIIPMPAILKKTASGFITIDGEELKTWIEVEVPDDTPTGENGKGGVVRESWNGKRVLKRKPTLEERAQIEATGYSNWYEWSIDNWGTKWDACEPEVHIFGAQILIDFNTAWGRPSPWQMLCASTCPKGPP
jgi:hypothetical protein